MLQGKGLWAYRSAELDRAIEIAPQMGVTHILYKVGQGTVYYSGRAEIAAKILAAGLIPIAWAWLLLDDPEAEAGLVTQAFAQGYEGYVFDTEANRCRNRFDEATALGEVLKDAGVDLNALYNCSYPNISHHRSLPYDQMNEFCLGGLMPMSYGSFFRPDSTIPWETQATRVLDEWTYGHYEFWVERWGYRPPLYPILGPYHGEYAQKRMDPDEFQIWLNHLAAYEPTFFSVFTAAVINENLFPLVKAFQLGELPADSTPSGLRVVVDSPDRKLNIRPLPSAELPPIGDVEHEQILECLEPAEKVREKVGQDGEWLHIRTIPDEDGARQIRGYVAAWQVRLSEEEPTIDEGPQLEVVCPDVGFANIRPRPSLEHPPIARADDGTLLLALESEEDVVDKLGQAGAWVHVRMPDGVEGYVSAKCVDLATGPVTHLIVHSRVGLNLRGDSNADSPVRWKVVDQTILTVVEDTSAVGDKLRKDRWIKVRTPSNHEGYVNGLYVKAHRRKDTRKPVVDSTLAYGESAWIFGMHAAGSTTPANFRHLWEGKGKTGWVLFTEAIGADANHGGGHDYTPWSYAGFGVIVRLNNRYEPGGTLPVQATYPGFALGCAEYVRRSRGCHIWIIGNEQNNVREHPGGGANPREHIWPEMYADAFNKARRAIKEVQPEAIVVPGAVDPYNTTPWRLANGLRYKPLVYFKEMMDAIEDLDGISLHTYTHWMDKGLITARTLFNDPFLPPYTPDEHYYDFQAYRPFAEAIPQKWRDRPIYLTESNHWLALDRPPADPGEYGKVGWVDADKGWVQAAYEEINRWNTSPFAQQIQCLLLYRWTGDEWAMERLGELHKDIRKALGNDYRWRS